jgi:hypothetical protein
VVLVEKKEGWSLWKIMICTYYGNGMRQCFCCTKESVQFCKFHNKMPLHVDGLLGPCISPDLEDPLGVNEWACNHTLIAPPPPDIVPSNIAAQLQYSSTLT